MRVFIALGFIIYLSILLIGCHKISAEETGTDTATGGEMNADADADSDTDTDADSDTDTDVDSDTDTGTDTDTDADADSDTDTDTDADADADSDTYVDADSDTNTNADGRSVVGNPCDTDDDCGPAYQCISDFGSSLMPDGYCSGYCNEDADCPKGTLCSPLPMSSVPGFCLLACDSDNDCRPGYDCALGRLFPDDTDTDGPGVSSGKICWTIYPVCTIGSDQTCNGDPFVSSFQGTCNKDGSCTCIGGNTFDPRTGLCYGPQQPTENPHAG
jgi:hypothetical protein